MSDNEWKPVPITKDPLELMIECQSDGLNDYVLPRRPQDTSGISMVSSSSSSSGRSIERPKRTNTKVSPLQRSGPSKPQPECINLEDSDEETDKKRSNVWPQSYLRAAKKDHQPPF